jgi:hypothetical protein
MLWRRPRSKWCIGVISQLVSAAPLGEDVSVVSSLCAIVLPLQSRLKSHDWDR